MLEDWAAAVWTSIELSWAHNETEVNLGNQVGVWIETCRQLERTYAYRLGVSGDQKALLYESWYQKTEVACGTQTRQQNMILHYSHQLDTLPACDGQTDGHTLIATSLSSIAERDTYVV